MMVANGTTIQANGVYEVIGEAVDASTVKEFTATEFGDTFGMFSFIDATRFRQLQRARATCSQAPGDLPAISNT